MMNINRFIATGNNVKDPSVTYTQGDKPMCVAKGSIAIGRGKGKNGEDLVDFLNYTAFGKTAEYIEKYGNKGVRMAIEGRIQTGSYTNKEGQKVYTTEIIVDRVEIYTKNSDSSAQTQPQAPATGDGFMNIPDGVEEEGLPFN